MDPLERLLAIEEIRLLKASYCRYLDTKDWKRFGECFAPHGVFDHGGDGPPLRGPENIVAGVRSVVDAVQLVHRATMPEIDVTSATTATGIWGLDDMLRWPDGRRSLHAYGHYHEEYEKVDGQWKITLSQVTQLRVDTESSTTSDWRLPD